MTTIKRVESSIERVEGFPVRILYHTGADIRSDKEGVPPYPFDRAAMSEMTVRHWKETRFQPNYPGFDVEVLDSSGRTCNGHCKLATVRETSEMRAR
jgi:hypothetical protein